jgi:hypothetical protein
MKYVGDRIIYLAADPHGNYAFRLPHYHRAAVGLFPNTQIFLVPTPKTRELIVTSIHPANWGDLWKLEITLADKPGSVRRIVSSLKEHNVNILVEESLSDFFDLQLGHQLSLILDLVKYTSAVDGDTSHRNEKPTLRPNLLINTIIASSPDVIRLSSTEDRFQLSFHRMEFFYRNKDYRASFSVSAMGLDGKLLIEPDLIDEIYEGRTPERVACHVISDTEEKYVKIKFLEPGKAYLLLGIEHSEEVGAILSFCDMIARRKVNIINSYSRLSRMNRNAWWFSFLELPAKFDKLDMRSLFDELQELDIVQGFTLRGHYGFDDLFGVEDLVDKSHYSKLVETRRSVLRSPSVETFIDTSMLVDHEPPLLDVRPYYEGRGWQYRPRGVFVSVSATYDERFYERILRHTLEALQFRPVRADDGRAAEHEPQKLPLYARTERAKRHIATCDFVIADLSSCPMEVIYQIGIADAVGKPVLIIAEERDRAEVERAIDLSQRLHLFYSPYLPVEQLSSSLSASIRRLMQPGR